MADCMSLVVYSLVADCMSLFLYKSMEKVSIMCVEVLGMHGVNLADFLFAASTKWSIGSIIFIAKRLPHRALSIDSDQTMVYL